MLAPYVARGVVIPASYDACRHAGRVLAALARDKRVDLVRAPRSFSNDVLIATSCREAGVVLVTDNARNFTLIRRYLRGFRFVMPWPLMAGR